MISDYLIDKHQVINVWCIFKKEETIAAGFIRAFLGECTNGKWLVVITDKFWEESEVLLLNTRSTAMIKIRKRGFYTRIRKVYSCMQRVSE